MLPQNNSHDGGSHSHAGFGDIAKILIDNNANVKIRGKKGEDPLILACFGGFDIVAAMIEKGADVNYIDPTGLIQLLLP